MTAAMIDVSIRRSGLAGCVIFSDPLQSLQFGIAAIFVDQ